MSLLNIYTSFQQKLNKCCHEVMVDNVGDHVVAQKSGDFQKKKVITFLAVICNAIRDQYE